MMKATTRSLLTGCLVAAAIGALAGTAYAGWTAHGVELFLRYVAAGLALRF